jgi:hypothetical protein
VARPRVAEPPALPLLIALRVGVQTADRAGLRTVDSRAVHAGRVPEQSVGATQAEPTWRLATKNGELLPEGQDLRGEVQRGQGVSSVR